MSGVEFSVELREWEIRRQVSIKLFQKTNQIRSFILSFRAGLGQFLLAYLGCYNDKPLCFPVFHNFGSLPLKSFLTPLLSFQTLRKFYNVIEAMSILCNTGFITDKKIKMFQKVRFKSNFYSFTFQITKN